MSVDELFRPRDHATLKELAERLGRPLYTLHVLDAKTDPFLSGRPARLRDAEWFAEVWTRVGGVRGFHLRRMHYRVLSQKKHILMPDSRPYINTEPCANTLYNGGRDARHLGLIKGGVLIDRKNPEAVINFQEAEQGVIASRGELGDLIEPTLQIPRMLLFPPRIGQRYLVEIWCEKSTMNDILMPLGQRLRVNVVTGTGELSEVRCWELVQRALATGLPVRILYVSDFDPAGMSMPVAVTRKIEFIIYREELYDLDIQLRPVLLTHDQCVEYRLPRTPNKDERRAVQFENRFGEGATELDALEALHPGELERILVREIERYYDPALAERVEETAADVQSDLDALTAVVHEAHAEDIARLTSERKKVLAAIKSFKRNTTPILRKIQKTLDAQAPDVEQYDWPEPADGDEDPNPMFDSTRSYLDQIERYKQHQGKSSERKPRKPFKLHKCICEVCGEKFLSRRPKARACNPSHRTTLWRRAKGIGGTRPGKPGRPPSEQPLTSAERNRRWRAKQKAKSQRRL